MTRDEATLAVYGLDIEEGKDERAIEELINKIYDDLDEVKAQARKKFELQHEQVLKYINMYFDLLEETQDV